MATFEVLLSKQREAREGHRLLQSSLDADTIKVHLFFCFKRLCVRSALSNTPTRSFRHLLFRKQIGTIRRDRLKLWQEKFEITKDIMDLSTEELTKQKNSVAQPSFSAPAVAPPPQTTIPNPYGHDDLSSCGGEAALRDRRGVRAARPSASPEVASAQPAYVFEF